MLALVYFYIPILMNHYNAARLFDELFILVTEENRH